MPEEYLEKERQAETKSEYRRGEVIAMAGATRRHNLITHNVSSSLHAQNGSRPGEVYASDMRVKVSAAGLYTYPDVVVVCGEPHFEDSREDTLVNPTLIVEVLSPSTEGYDRGEKFEQYRRLPWLAEYVLIAQDKVHVEHFARRPDNTWVLTEAESPADTIELAAPKSGHRDKRPEIGGNMVDLDLRAQRVTLPATEEGPADPVEFCYAQGWTDGLPVVPPTPERVRAMLAGTRRDPQELLGPVPPRGGKATVEAVAINAVMAGCKPEYLPVVLAAVEGSSKTAST